MDIEGILSVAFSVLVGAIPAVLIVVKKISKVAKESGQLFTAVSKGLEDGKLTGDEIRNIIEEAKDVGKAVMDIRNKTV